MKRIVQAACLLAIAGLIATPVRAETDADRAQRWTDLQHAMFGDHAVLDGHAVLSLDAPARADDAALVPMAINTHDVGHAAIKGLYLLIDDNPSPLAAHFTFGPDADPHEIRLRVRVNQYTNVHAIAETQDGRLFAVARFVKAAGGCSAPAGANDVEALKGLGEMKLRILSEGAGSKSIPVQLLIRHPNFNGMQMDQVTRLYTPARFLNVVDVTYNGASVFHLDSDISMSTNPAITFSLVPQDKGRLTVVARDSMNTSFTQSFNVPAPGS